MGEWDLLFKTAIVMLHGDLPAAEVHRVLAATGGFVRRAIDREVP